MGLIDFDNLDKKKKETQGTVIILAGSEFVCKSLLLEEVREQLKPDTTIDWVSDGDWSMIELFMLCLQYTGPCDVYLSSYAFSEQPARILADLKSKGEIKQLHCLIDSRIDTRSAGALQLIQATADRCKLMDTHAKVTVLINKVHQLVIVGSANYTKNERYEAGIVSTIPARVFFHQQWMQYELERTDS